MNIFDAKQIHFTGIKGVAMTSLAQCLVDLKKVVSGSDLSDHFVTQPILDTLPIQLYKGFSAKHISDDTELLIYTAAHKGPDNPEVIAANEKGIATLSQAEALSQLFNQKQGIAVCGVGGKSTISAMLSWIFTKEQKPVSYSVGVGQIIGLPKTGQWQNDAEYFIAEADEYVVDPAAPAKGEPIIPRFSFLKPYIIVCTGLRFDHPDVYKDFNHTKKVFLSFFKQLKPNGKLVIPSHDQALQELVNQLTKERTDIQVITFGDSEHSKMHLCNLSFGNTQIMYSITTQSQTYNGTLLLPGKYNCMNATAAITAANIIGISINSSMKHLKTFRSTKRRFEYVGDKNGVKYYDDYAHHPEELKAVTTAARDFFKGKKVLVAFQPHTYSRTKVLFDDFAESLNVPEDIVLLNIFASARESASDSVSSKMLVKAVKKLGKENIKYVGGVKQFGEFLKKNEYGYEVVLTLGAGDIYTIYELLESVSKEIV